MSGNNVINFFLPDGMRHNPHHPRYYEFFTIASLIFTGALIFGMLPIPLWLLGIKGHLWLYAASSALNFLTLVSMRVLSNWRFVSAFSGVMSYFLLYKWLKDSGLIYSSNMSMVHLILLCAVLTERKWGWLATITNLIFIVFLYVETLGNPVLARLSGTLSGPGHALAMHSIITIFVGGLSAYTMRILERNRKRINHLQDQKISMLDEAVRLRTEQLNSIRQTIASDFHDQTGNMLAAIARQTAILELKLADRADLQSLLQSITHNSNALYASSRDFIWNLNSDSDNPQTLFQYLAGYGQNYYNQFDISFSTETCGAHPQIHLLDPFAALNLIYIFKEAMGNVIRHSGADEVVMIMNLAPETVSYMLRDNGVWKEADPEQPHYGLSNMQRRCKKSGFGFELSHEGKGTAVTVSLPLNSSTVNNATR